MSHAETMMLFADTSAASDRINAIDILHGATAIYTAEEVVDNLLDRVKWPHGKSRICDPSAGDGQFIGRALTRALAVHAFTDEELPDMIEGWEIHPHACVQARARIEAILVAHGRPAKLACELAEKIIHNRDFLTQGPVVPTWDVIAGNPPYLRWVNVPKILQQDYAEHVPHYASGDMLHSFLDRCSKVLREDGEIALVTSDRWLQNLGASALREALGKNLGIRHLERLDVNTAFYRPKQRKAGSPPRIHPVSVVLSGGGSTALTRDPIYPGANTERYKGMPTLADIATVKIAPWLGTAGIFVMTAEEAERSGIPIEMLVPAVDTDDIIGNVLGKPTRYAIRTDPNTVPCEAVMRHLEGLQHLMASRGRMSKMWLPPETFHKMDLSKPYLLVPRIAKTPKSVRVPAGILPINHNLSIVAGSDALLEKVERALASDLAADWVSEHAARLENGYFSLTTTLLRKLPIASE